MKAFDKETQTYKELRIKPGGDTLPIGTIVEYAGDTVPEGYEEVTEGIVTGQEYETGRVIDGKKEYGKRISFGALPNNTTKEVDIGVTNVVFTKAFEAIAYKSGAAITLPLVSATAISSNVYIAILSNKINITTKADYSSYTNCFVEIFYTKNTD